MLPMSKQRRYERVSLRGGPLVAWQNSGARVVVSRVATLGLGGLFIESTEPAAIGEGIRMVFRVGDGDVRARAVVRNFHPGKGMGVEFIFMRPEDRARLGRAVRRLMARPGGNGD